MAFPRAARQAVSQTADTPARLTDQEFWKLSQDFSEPNGSFASDNLVSNEIYLRVVPDLVTRARQGGVYLGVGPSRTSITSRRSSRRWSHNMRRGNLHMHLIQGAVRADG